MVNINEATRLVEALIMLSEGFCSHPYLCPAGVPTIAFGSTYYTNGVRVTLHDRPVTKDEGRALLRYQVRTQFMPAVLKLAETFTTPGQLAAITDFAFNLGLGNLRASTLLRCIRRGDWNAVPEQLRRWVNAGGKRQRGLVIRREREIALL